MLRDPVSGRWCLGEEDAGWVQWMGMFLRLQRSLRLQKSPRVQVQRGDGGWREVRMIIVRIWWLGDRGVEISGVEKLSLCRHDGQVHLSLWNIHVEEWHVSGTKIGSMH